MTKENVIRINYESQLTFIWPGSITFDIVHV